MGFVGFVLAVEVVERLDAGDVSWGNGCDGAWRPPSMLDPTEETERWLVFDAIELLLWIWSGSEVSFSSVSRDIVPSSMRSEALEATMVNME